MATNQNKQMTVRTSPSPVGDRVRMVTNAGRSVTRYLPVPPEMVEEAFDLVEEVASVTDSVVTGVQGLGLGPSRAPRKVVGKASRKVSGSAPQKGMRAANRRGRYKASQIPPAPYLNSIMTPSLQISEAEPSPSEGGRIISGVFRFDKTDNSGTQNLGSGFGTTFQLSSLPSATDFDVFAQYRIDNVSVLFWDARNVAEIGSPAYGTTGRAVISTAIDYEKVTAPSITGIQEYENMQFSTLGTKDHAVTLVPRIHVNSGGTDVVAEPRQWINMSDKTVPHYGLVYFIGNSHTTGTPAFAYQIGRLDKYELSFYLFE